MIASTAIRISHRVRTLISGGPARYHVIIYFDGPLTKWIRSTDLIGMREISNGAYEPMTGEEGRLPRKPDHREILCQSAFRRKWMAILWAVARVSGMRNCIAEVWPL